MSYQLDLPLLSPQTYDAADFYVTQANQEAHDYLQTWPHWPHFCCIIYGQSGAGKTHLSHLFQQKSGAVYGTLPYRKDATSVILDGLDLTGVLNKEMEESLFHLYNALKLNNQFLLILTKASPFSWHIRLPDLSSRLKSSPRFQLHQPDDDLLTVLYAKLFADHQLRVPPQVIKYIVQNTERSFENAPILVDSIRKISLRQKRNISIPFLRQILNNDKLF